MVSFSRLPASGAVALDLGLAEGTEIYAFERLRCADGEPLALMRNHVPADVLPLTAGSLEQQGLYNLLRAAVPRALGESKAAPLLTMERTAYDDRGRVVEHGSHLYRASRYSFDLTLTGW